MSRRRLLFIAVSLLCVVAVLNYIALHFYLYWTLDHFDSLVHFLAGIVVGLCGVWVYALSGNTVSKQHIITVALLSGLLVGIMWELFEVYGHMTFPSDGLPYVLDTLSDILCDTFGSFLAAVYVLSVNYSL